MSSAGVNRKYRDQSYKYYYTVKPCQSRLLQREWDENDQRMHRQKIASAKPMVNTKAPRTYVHMHLKLKKIRLEEERLFIIERDNRILLEKMCHIARTGGRLDNQNDYIPKSLNKAKRRNELLRVTLENQQIMERISQCKAEYDPTQWKRDWSQKCVYFENIARYPPGWWETNRSEEEKEKDDSEKDKENENENEENSIGDSNEDESDKKKDVKDESDKKKDVKDESDKKKDVKDESDKKKDVKDESDKKKDVKDESDKKKDVKDESDKKKDVKDESDKKKDVKDESDKKKDVKESPKGEEEKES